MVLALVIHKTRQADGGSLDIVIEDGTEGHFGGSGGHNIGCRRASEKVGDTKTELRFLFVGCDSRVGMLLMGMVLRDLSRVLKGFARREAARER